MRHRLRFEFFEATWPRSAHVTLARACVDHDRELRFDVIEHAIRVVGRSRRPIVEPQFLVVGRMVGNGRSARLVPGSRLKPYPADVDRARARRAAGRRYWWLLPWVLLVYASFVGAVARFGRVFGWW